MLSAQHSQRKEISSFPVAPPEPNVDPHWPKLGHVTMLSTSKEVGVREIIGG